MITGVNNNSIHMVDLIKQHQRIKQEINQAINTVIDNSTFINGPEVKKFSSNLSNFLKCKHVIPCANGTDALQIALMSLDLPFDSEIIVPTFNYVAAAEAIAFLGYKPVFVDSDKDTFNLDIHSLEKKISPYTKVIIAVHLFGQVCDMDIIMAIAKKYNLYVIEDNAQAIGAQYKHKDGTISYAGTIGDIGTTSFFPSKNLSCMGDGGALMTNNDQLAEKARCIANHGQEEKYTYKTIGINSRLDTIQAAILDVKLKYLPEYTEKRFQAAQYYHQLLGTNSEVTLPTESKNSTHVYHQYTIQVKQKNRDQIVKQLKEKGIPSMVYYPSPLHLQEAYTYLGYKKGSFPNAEYLSNVVISLPMHPELTKVQQDFICDHLLSILQ